MKIKKMLFKYLDALLKESPMLSRNYGFVILYYTSWIFSSWLQSQNYTLTKFTGRVISNASANLYDVNSRIEVIALSLILIVIIIFFASVIFHQLDKYILPEIKTIIQASSFIGVLSFYFYIFTSKLPTTEVFVAISTIQTCYILYSFLQKKLAATSNQLASPLHASWLFIMSFSITSFIYSNEYIHKTLGLSDKITLPMTISTIILFSISYVWVTFAKKISPQETDEQLLASLFLATVPLILLTSLSSLSNEFYLILNHHKIYTFDPTRIFWSGAFILSVSCILLHRYRNLFRFSGTQILSNFYFPIFIFCVTVLLWYSPYVNAPTDMFEPANPGLMIQQLFEFGKIPFLETFNAHGFSDAIWGLLYASINGYNSLDWTSYDFLQRTFELLIIYFFIKGITKNQYIAIGTTLLLPHLDVLFPTYFTVSILILQIFLHSLKSKRWTSYMVIAVILACLLLWKIDIAITSILAIIATCIFSFAALIPIPIHWKRLFVAFNVVGAIAIGAFIILCETKGINITTWAKQLSHILNSNQAFASTKLWDKESPYSAWNYFVSPLILIIGILFLIIQNRLEKTTLQKTITLSYFFVASFTLLNLTLRGAVRHTLIEDTSIIVSTFTPLALGGLTYFSTKRYGIYTQFSGFIIITLCIVHQFSLPKNVLAEKSGNLNEAITQTAQLSLIQPKHHYVERGIPPRKDTYTQLNKFIEYQLDENETFFDFSTSPMLYAYTHKPTPFYPNHLMLMHDDYLQERVLEDLNKYNIPLLVFSYVPPFTYNLDYIPFQLRYYKLTEYFYQNYHPYAIMDSREIWIRNDWKPRTSNPETVKEYTQSLKNTEAHEISRDENPVTFRALGTDPFITHLIQEKTILETQSSYYLHIEGNSQNGGNIQVFYAIDNKGFTEDHSKSQSIGKGEVSLDIPIITPETKNKSLTLDDLRIDIESGDIFSFKKLALMKSDGPVYQKINHSTLSQDFQEKYIPYVWGNFDLIDPGKLHVIREVTKNQFLYGAKKDPSSQTQKYTFVPLTNEEKRHGMYIVLNIQAEAPATKQKEISARNTKDKTITLRYGDDLQENGSVQFSILNDGRSHKYIVRISTQYSWVDFQNSWISIDNQTFPSLGIEKISITRSE